MPIAGIVAEYNPFHSGHAYQIAETRARGFDAVVVVMSGHTVQRGALSCMDKWSRAKAALCGGADLVLELPAIYASASAERFAEGAVSLLRAFGCDAVSFGSESGDLSRLQQAVERLQDPQTDAAIRAALVEGMSYPAARQKALGELLLDTPNDILGVEYLKALRGTGMDAVAIPRVGAGHDAATAKGGFASASALRGQLFTDGPESLCGYVPDTAMAVYRAAAVCDPAALERVLLHRFRSMTPADFAALPDDAEGLSNRLHRCAREARSIDELLFAVKTKRYTLARIRRMLLAAAVGITAEDRAMEPPYLRVLAATAKGTALLSETDGRRTLPLSASLARCAECSPHAARCAAIESAATDLFSLGCTPILPCGVDYTQKAVIIKDR